MSDLSHERKSQSDMRLHENREILTNIEHHHLNLDGSSDLRYKENHQKPVTNDVDGLFILTSNRELILCYAFFFIIDPAFLLDIPTKKDGTADLRYAESKEAETLGVITSDEVIEGKNLILLTF